MLSVCNKNMTSRKLAKALYRDFFPAFKIENFILNFLLILMFAQNIDCGYTLEPPRPQSMFWIKIKKKGIPL